MNDKPSRGECTSLPEGWIRESIPRKTGATAGRCDVYYYSPEGRKCRSKPQMALCLPDDFDIESFDYRTGQVMAELRHRKRPRDNFNFSRDFMSQNVSKPHRSQAKRAREGVKPDYQINEKEADCKIPPRNAADVEIKRKRAENLSQRPTSKPRQLFWHRRLQGILPVDKDTEQNCKVTKLDDLMKGLLEGSDSQATLNSVMYCLFNNTNTVQGQAMYEARQSNFKKNPGAWCDSDQPYTAPFTISDDTLREQERQVEMARRKLTEAEDLLKALENEKDEIDQDDMME